MDENISKENNDKKEKKNSNSNFVNIKSKYILKKIFEFLLTKKSFEIIKHNKIIKSLLEISINSYKEYSELEIEIILAKNKFGNFINLSEKNEKYFQIFFDKNKKDIKKYSINKKDLIKKIKVITTHKFAKSKSLQLFKNCECIESISLKCYRNIFNNISNMFRNCSSLKKIEFIHFNIENIHDISYMFAECKSLEIINFSDFNTENVTDMNSLFYDCKSLKRLNLLNFKTQNVTDMSYMFFCCESLKELNILNFNTENVSDMGYMFFNCKSLMTVNFSNFRIIDNTRVRGMFTGCLREFQNKIKALNKNIDDGEFIDDMNLMENLLD